MDLKIAIESRRSIREFKDEPVDIGDIREIIRLAGMAPSINNYQPWKYYAVTNTDILRQMNQHQKLELGKWVFSL